MNIRKEILKNSILILCTGNSCRSQMEEGFIKSFDDNFEIYSVGTKLSEKVNPNAVQVMKEIGIDISKNYSKDFEQFVNKSLDYVITVCDNAKLTCPVFIVKVGKQLHIGFENPADANGTEEEILVVFRKVRDEIKDWFYQFYLNELK